MSIGNWSFRSGVRHNNVDIDNLKFIEAEDLITIFHNRTLHPVLCWAELSLVSHDRIGITHSLRFPSLFIMTAITSADNPSQPPLVPSVWNHLTSLAEEREKLAGSKSWGQGHTWTDNWPRAKAEVWASSDHVGRRDWCNLIHLEQLKPGHELSKAALRWDNASCLTTLTGLWHASALVKLGRQIYIYSSTFAPKHWTIAHPRRELEGISIPRHFVQLLICPQPHKYRNIVGDCHGQQQALMFAWVRQIGQECGRWIGRNHNRGPDASDGWRWGRFSSCIGGAGKSYMRATGGKSNASRGMVLGLRIETLQNTSTMGLTLRSRGTVGMESGVVSTIPARNASSSQVLAASP